MNTANYLTCTQIMNIHSSYWFPNVINVKLTPYCFRKETSYLFQQYRGTFKRTLDNDGEIPHWN